MTIFDDNVGLRVLALLAEHELVDEAVKVILQLGAVMSTIDDPAVIRGVNVGLSTELETKVLDDVGTRTGKRLSNTAQVDNNSLDTVALAFDLGLDLFHLITIEGVRDVAANIDESHDCGIAINWLRLQRLGNRSW